MKVVINRSYGGFRLSYEGVKRYFEIKGWDFYCAKEGDDYKVNSYVEFNPEKDNTAYRSYFRNYIPEPFSNRLSVEKQNKIYEDAGWWDCYDLERTDPVLIQVVEELGKAANDFCSKLLVVEIPDDIKWHISQHDGMETVEEEHRSWPE
jgi:hypothetical protein